MNINITLIRHGKTNGNLLKQYIGKTDEPLCMDGIDEINLSKHLFPLCEYVFVSPMKRCVQTANIIYKDSIHEYIDELKECDFGDFECKTYDELKNTSSYQAWLNTNGESTYHNGESNTHFKKRCIDGFNKIIDICAKKHIYKIAVVCHGGTIMSILDKFSYPNKSFYNWQVKNGEGFNFDFSLDNQSAQNIKPIRGNK